ncbi:MAG TPA: TetR/AcrR family transcriptional regulator [Spirochaetota bacterium]|nr:TetR/AcrR family transcriptional regulator [Spirochaetota bacterium]OPZ36501.1 MAG: HTH-type transcriptional regulator AcrR [Spirochaetes bacterium ADurb.BinA120]HNU90620.1 TetR/AcrR family transcriptional regulator [Spirochaetota bacterium]HPV98615.1 TetR/AcrR family transcriptional regulator [Spirochaetota bacterium]
MKNNNKGKILDVSRRLFLKYGYNGISIRTIASRAKLTTGAVYFHFKNKRDIYTTICLEAIEMLLSKFAGGMDRRRSNSQKLISTFDSYLEFFYRHGDYYNILMEYKAEFDQDGDSGREAIAAKMAELLRLMSQAVAAGIEAGEFRPVDPMMLSLFLASVAEGMLQYKKLGLMAAMKIEDADFRAFMIDVISYGITAQPQSSAKRNE